MALLSGNNLGKSFGERVLFSEVNFEVQSRDMIGLVGANGCGKTTLFKIITGQLEPDKGGVSRVSGLSVGYMEQHACADSSRTALEEALAVFRPLMDMERELAQIEERLAADHSAELIDRQLRLSEQYQRDGGLTYLSRTKAALAGLGFSPDEMELPVSALSGGQKSKIGLARLLLSSPGLLLLDEPTNHLDIPSVEWLEEYLKSSAGAAIIISHDRYFLDRVTARTFEIEHGRLMVSEGNYSRHLELKAERQAAEQKQYDNTVKEIRRIEGIIAQQRQWNREKNIKTAESKQKQVDRMTASLQKPERAEDGIRFRFSVRRDGGNDVLLADRLSMRFGHRILYENVCLDLKRGERIFLIGSNGCGKTTLLKQILSRPEGVRFGAGVTPGYFDQTQSTLNPDKTALDEVWDAYRDMSETEVRNALAAFLFKGDSVYKSVGTLSGGERARIAICKLMLSGANLLLLDEPTNHLDLYSREALEQALLDYPGSLLVVSHDRYFINKLADKVCLLTAGGLDCYFGNYDSYLGLRRPAEPQPASEKKPVGEGGRQYLVKKQQESELRRMKTALKRCEETIAETEGRITELSLRLERPDISSDYEKAMELSSEIDRLQGGLLQKMEEWEAITEVLENEPF